MGRMDQVSLLNGVGKTGFTEKETFEPTLEKRGEGVSTTDASGQVFQIDRTGSAKALQCNHTWDVLRKAGRPE